MKGDPRNPLDWLALARRDLSQARKNAAESACPYALFWCQQAAEKALKAWLIGRGWELLKTHNLRSLANEAKARGLELDWFDLSASRLTDLYFAERYVVISTEEDPDPTPEETTRLLADVTNLIETLFPSCQQ